MASMKIAVIGTGGIGGYYGSQLIAAGEEVHFLSTQRHVDAVRARGLIVKSDDSEKTYMPASITTRAEEIGHADIVLNTVKLYQLRESMENASPLIATNTLVVSTQNGVTAPETIAEYVGRERSVAGLCVIVSYAEAAGRIRQVGFLPKFTCGAHPLAQSAHSEAEPRISQFIEALGRGAVIAQTSNNIELDLWKKFALITTFGGVCGLARATIGQVRDYPPTREMQKQSLAEARAVANARGIALTEADTEAILEQLDALAPESTTSMQRDIEAGRPCELEDLNGTLVRFGEEVGVDTPLTRIATACMGLQIQAGMAC